MDAALLKFLNGSEQNHHDALKKQFPRVFEKITELWNWLDFEAYMIGQMTTVHPNRQDFPREVVSDIIYLIMLRESSNAPVGTNN